MAVSISIGITQNSQSVANNTSNVTVKLTMSWTSGTYNHTSAADGPAPRGTITIDGTSYSYKSLINENRTTSGSKVIFNDTFTIKHNTDGKKTLSCSANFNTGITKYGTVKATASKALTTIPRKSTLSVGNGTLGTAQTLTVTEQASSFTHTITAKCGSVSKTICTKSTSNSISFTPPLDWAKQNTTGTSLSVTYTITTYSGDTNIGSNTYTKTCSIPASVKPTCTVAVSDATSCNSTYGAYVKGLSKLKVVVTPTKAYDSPIASYKTTANGGTYTTASFTTGEISKTSNTKISATVTDKRGRTSVASEKTVTIVDYFNPKINKLSVSRCDEDGTANDQGEYVKITIDATITNINSKNINNTNYTLKYKKTTEDSYNTIALDISDKTYTTGEKSYIVAAESGSSYNVQFVVGDSHNETARGTTVSTAFTIMHWNAAGDGMALGKVSELSSVLDIGFQTRFYGGILHPVLEPETDLDDVLTPNTYVGANVSTYNYGHCPLTTGTFTLEVVGMGEEGRVKQKLTYCHKTASRTWERIYYASTWGEWICVSDFDGQLLWEGGFFMHDTQEINLAEPVSKQRSGIVLVFCRYSSGTIQNYHFSYHFVPKMMVVMHGGCGSVFQMGAIEGDYFASKYLYISDQSIKGNAYNDDVITDATNGITYTNNATVLRYVIGV